MKKRQKLLRDEQSASIGLAAWAEATTRRAKSGAGAESSLFRRLSLRVANEGEAALSAQQVCLDVDLVPPAEAAQGVALGRVNFSGFLDTRELLEWDAAFPDGSFGQIKERCHLRQDGVPTKSGIISDY
jgi:hypothetical protein